MWSLGVMLFELCTGHTLFGQDIANDELVDAMDLTRLCVWHTVSDDDLSEVFFSAAVSADHLPLNGTLHEYSVAVG